MDIASAPKRAEQKMLRCFQVQVRSLSCADGYIWRLHLSLRMQQPQATCTSQADDDSRMCAPQRGELCHPGRSQSRCWRGRRGRPADGTRLLASLRWQKRCSVRKVPQSASTTVSRLTDQPPINKGRLSCQHSLALCLLLCSKLSVTCKHGLQPPILSSEL